jgi:hypothetical protein
MDNPTTTEPTGGLPLVKGEMLGKSGLNVLGNKGVALGMDDSASIRDYLQQMINQRQAYKGSFEQGMDQMRSVLGDTQNQMAQNMQAQSAKERTNEQDVFNMRVNMAQLKTQEDRLLQEKMQAAQNQLNFTNAMRADQGLPPLPSAPQAGMAPAPQAGMAPAPQAGMAPAPQAGMAPAPQGGAAPAPQARPSNISSTQMAILTQMYADPSTRAEAQKQYLTLSKKDDIERRMESAGIVRGSPTWNQMLALNIAGPGSFTPHDVRGVGGTGQQTPFGAVGSALGTPSAPAPQPNVGPAPVVAAPAPQGAPVVAAPAPVAAATAPARPPAPMAAAPTPTQGSPFAPGTKEDLEWRQKQAGVTIAGDTKEAEKMAETLAAEQTALRAAADAAPTNILLANQVMQDVKEHKDLFAKLNQPSLGSALAGLMKSGVQIGQFGSISVPGINDFLQQVDPGAKDNPKRLEAWTRITASMAQINLDYAQRVMKGQGAVSNFERELVERAVGDINRDSARNMMVKMKMLEIASANAQQISDKWGEAQKAGLNWQQFKSSPTYKDIKREQYYNTAKTMQIKNPPKYPGDA